MPRIKGGEVMRVQFRFKISELPIGYRLGILSIIKEMVRNGSNEYYQEIFEDKKSSPKPFAYSIYIQNISLYDQIITGDELVVIVSSSSYEFMMNLLNGSRKKQEYKYKNYTFLLISKRMLPTYHITHNCVTFQTKSPILIESKNKKPVLSTDPNFEEEFQYISSLLIKELYHRQPFEPIQILQTSMKKQVIKEFLHQESDKPLYLTTNKGLIQLKGNPQDLQVIYDNGVSFRRSLGLGLLDVVEEVTGS